jgi:methyltransferase (TIGR00027 family)
LPISIFSKPEEEDMEKQNPSRSAETVTIFKAAEYLRPLGQRICEDHLAVFFLRRRYQYLGKSRLLVRLATWLVAERRFPGCVGSVVARTRYFDDCLRSAIQQGIEQLVILGAGYDTRAYRFEELKTNIKAYEIDRRATIMRKMKTVKGIFGELPSHVVFVPVDFETDSLRTQLFSAGYDAGKKTAFIWEGVTYYLDSEAVDKTLDFVANQSGPGSEILFDYFDASVLNGNNSSTVVKKFFQYAAKKGEPFKFGISDGKLEVFLVQRGLTLTENLTSESAKAIYFRGKNRHRTVLPIFKFARAQVHR